MRIKAVFPAKNYILYVTFEEKIILKYDMSYLIETDTEFFELKYNPELFIEVRPVNEQRSLGWRDNIILHGEVIEKNGVPVNLGYLELWGDDYEELKRHAFEPIVKKALSNRYGSILFFEEGEFAEFDGWLDMGFVSNLDSHDEPTDLALIYESMQDRMIWLQENKKDWFDFLHPGTESGR